MAAVGVTEWDEMLRARHQEGADDAALGIYDPPYPSSDDPQDSDERDAYRDGWKTKRCELGAAFRWSDVT